jgi:hypothetical protein
MTKVEGGQESATQEADARNGQEIPEVQKEPESTSGQSMTSAQGTDGVGSPKPSAVHRVVATLPSQNRGSDTFSISVKVKDCARTIHRGGGSRDSLRTLNGQWTSTADSSTQRCSTFSTDLAQWPVTHLVGMIRASTDQLEKRLQQAERSTKYARDEVLLVQACRTQEAHEKIQVEHRLERVQERLAQAWPEIQKVAPQLPEASDAGESEHQIELLQGAWTQLATHAEHMEVQL